MPQLESPEFTDILGRIATWPDEKKRDLAEVILRDVKGERGAATPPRKTLRDLLGLLKADGRLPTDDEYRRILEDELIKKHLK